MKYSSVNEKIIILIGLAILTSLIPIFSLDNFMAHAQDTQCKVEILGGPSLGTSPRMYNGQLAFFSANVSGTIDDNITYTWAVEGPIIKGFDNDTDDPDPSQLSSVRGIEDPTPMSPGDFHRQTIDFYWRNTTDTNRTVTVNVQTPSGECEAIRNFIVDQNSNNLNLQAEDFYVENNQTFGNRNHTSEVLKEHQEWHTNWRQPDKDYNGTTFFDFHNAFLAHFDAWRDLFGYPKIVAWNPDTEIGTGADIDHTNRHEEGYFCSPDYPLCSTNYTEAIGPLPSYFKVLNGSGNENRENRTRIMDGERLRHCETIPDSSTFPQNSLDDFDPNLQLLGCAVTDQYHDHLHVATGQFVPAVVYLKACPGCATGIMPVLVNGTLRDEIVHLGDLSAANTAPRDPLFWRLHKFVDNIAYNRTNIDDLITSILDTENGLTSNIFSLALDSTILEDLTPPRINFSNPFTLNPKIAALPLISEKERDLFGITGVPAISAQFNEPVIGVKAEDFLVNGFPATRVNGSGAGPYVFIGFKQPEPGIVNVTFSPGNITDPVDNKFEGASWRYEIINENLDNDSDGLRDGLEITEFHTDPNNTDTDNDTIPDGFEAASTTCLDPLENDAHFMDIAGNILSEEGLDSDLDNVSNVNEFNLGTDPCLAPQASDLQGESNLQGILPLTVLSDHGMLPITLILKTTGNNAGLNNILSYNSLTREAVSVVNGNETTTPISNVEEETVIRTLNVSGFFDLSSSIYPPSPNSTDYTEFTLFASLGNEVNIIYWTEASEGVPESIKNLPFALTNILGTR